MESRINETEYSDDASHLIQFHELFIKPRDKDNSIQVMELFKQFVEGSFSKYFKGRIKSTNQVFTDYIECKNQILVIICV